MFGPGYLSELAYTLMGVNAVITWAKLFKCELHSIQNICAATIVPTVSALCLKQQLYRLSRYLNSFPHLAMLSTTLKNAFHPVRNFSIMFL